MKRFITEPKKEIPIIREADVCVIGGSCTGVFAAVRAARLGMRVVLIERHGQLGGAATTGLVNIWHSLYSTDCKQQIIAGLTEEVITILKQRGAVVTSENSGSAYNFNPVELSLLLDQLVVENHIDLMLHTMFCDAVCEERKVNAVIVENSDGRGAIEAKFFIDATGDGFVSRAVGIPSYVSNAIQPPTACFHLQGNMDGVNMVKMVREHGAEFGLDDHWGWSTGVAGCKGISMRADRHISGYRCDIADDLTAAEVDGRRQTRAIISMLKKYGREDSEYSLTNICSSLGIRETVHYRTRLQAGELPLLTGERYSNPILNGTYPVDIHHENGGGITFRYLNGNERIEFTKEKRTETGNWRERLELTGEPATYYQVPFDVPVCEEYDNFIAAGRMLNADNGAFGALRVMVNLNQLGEAAGVAAALCLCNNSSLKNLDGTQVTYALIKGGSAL